jgi:hypothetical protein
MRDALSARVIFQRRDIMSRRTTLTLTTIALLSLAVGLPAANGVAQEKQRVSFKVSTENAKYTQQHAIEVGDASGHQVRVYEVHYTFPGTPPVFNGVKLVEIWSRATSDYTDNTGPSAGYNVFGLENGDKFFSRYSAVTERPEATKSTFTQVGPITGGTGKFAGIRGVIRATGTADPKAGFNETQWDLEYSMEK